MNTPWIDPRKTNPKNNQKVDVLTKEWNAKNDAFDYERLCDHVFNIYENRHHKQWGIPEFCRVVGWMPIPEIGEHVDPQKVQQQ